MKALLNSWWRRFEFYSFWEGRPKRPLDWDEEDTTKPLIHFSIEAWQVETHPSSSYNYNDTERWRGIHIRAYISRRLIGISIPYWPLPDHVPTEKQLKRRAIYDTPEHRERMQKLNDVLSDMNNATKKV